MTTLPEIKELLVQIRDDQRRLVKLAEVFCKLQLHLMRLQARADELDPGCRQGQPAGQSEEALGQ